MRQQTTVKARSMAKTNTSSTAKKHKRVDSIKKGRNNIEMLVLSILRHCDCYGYQLTQEINSLSEDMLYIPEGSLYPALYRLEEEGCITSEKKLCGRRMERVYYHILPKGEEYLKDLQADYEYLNKAIAKVLTRKGPSICDQEGAEQAISESEHA